MLTAVRFIDSLYDLQGTREQIIMAESWLDYLRRLWPDIRPHALYLAAASHFLKLCFCSRSQCTGCLHLPSTCSDALEAPLDSQHLVAHGGHM